MNLNTDIPDEAVTRLQIPEHRRELALPHHFGPHMLLAERLVYSYARHLCIAYSGGYWEFFELSNGGFYMAMDRPPTLRVEVDGNGFSGDVAADAAGIIICLFAFCDLAERTGVDAHAEMYHRLRDYALAHKDANVIAAAID